MLNCGAYSLALNSFDVLHCHARREIGIPGGGQRDTSGHCSCRTKVTDPKWSISHFQRRDTKSRNAANKEVVYTTKHVDLLFERHLAQKSFDARFNCK